MWLIQRKSLHWLLAYLVVDSCDDSGPHSHAYDKGSVEVLVEEEGLDQGGDKQHGRVEVAMPGRLGLILCELDHQSTGTTHHM